MSRTHPPALPPIAVEPPPRPLTGRQVDIVEAALAVLDVEGPPALTMARLGAELGIRGPSLYKHVAGKADIELLAVERSLREMGSVTHAAVADPGPQGPVAALLSAYRRTAVALPHRYRLATAPIDRARLTPGLEEWAGEPFFLATGEPHLAQALWSFAHGTAVLEIDHRFTEGSDLDRTWAAGAEAFARSRAA